MSASGWHRKATDTPAEQARRRKYASREHRQRKADERAQLKRNGQQPCAERPCILNRPLFHNDPSGVVLAHTPDGVGYRGLAHQPCNASEAAVRGVRKRNGVEPVGVTAMRL